MRTDGRGDQKTCLSCSRRLDDFDLLEGITNLLLASVLTATVIGVIVLVVVHVMTKESMQTDREPGPAVERRKHGESIQSARSSQLRRILEATLLLAFWMAIGLVFKLEANTYLLFGVPLTVGFQLFVRKEPLRALWVRSAPSLKLAGLNTPAKLIAFIFAVGNALLLYEGYLANHSWIFALYQLVAICGAILLAYSFHNVTKQTFRPFLTCLATAGGVAVGFDLITYWLRVFALHIAQPVSVTVFLSVWLVSMVEYLPVVFLLEEVWFRGAFDSHVYHFGEKYPNLTALCVSLLWGVWHFPIVYTPAMGLAEGITTLVFLLAFQGAVGYFLSIYWRKSGNLLVPGSVHAFADAVRNGLTPL